MTYSDLYIETAISEAQEAIERFTLRLKQSQEFEAEFEQSDPETAQIYRDWEDFYHEKLDYFQLRLVELQGKCPKCKDGYLPAREFEFAKPFCDCPSGQQQKRYMAEWFEGPVLTLRQLVRTDPASPAVDHIMSRFGISDRGAAHDVLKERD